MSKKVVVIGAGMVGIVAASFLQRDGHTVAVVDPNGPGEGASFGNAGGLNPSSVVPMSMPGIVRNVPKWLSDPLGPLAIRWTYLPSLLPWLIRFIRAGTPERVESQARALRDLLGPCLDCLEPLVKAADAQDLVHRRGALFVSRSKDAFTNDRAAWDLRRRHGVKWDDLNADEIRQLEPTLSHDYVRGIFVRENGHTSNPHRLVSRLAEAFQRGGGTIIRSRVLDFEFDGAQLRAVRTTDGSIAAEIAVVAAGVHSKPLAAALGDRIPLETERGYHIVLRNPEIMPRIPLADVDAKLVATPMETGLRFAGIVELAGLTAPPNWRRADILLERGRRMLPSLAGSHAEESLSRWMGHRPSTPDSLPVIGPARRSPDVFYAFGHGHVGMAAAPTTGKIIGELVGGKVPSIPIEPFRAGRF
ncbi:MAG: FAD-binding oxidoreductase [Proteobacteria bacterium]|nr:FAD-binding oxidoreductase [Pseudomonadota bacterium]MBI3497670.1 FAD-binding oxidoreductase [Pseudomonadota bacterium]